MGANSTKFMVISDDFTGFLRSNVEKLSSDQPSITLSDPEFIQFIEGPKSFQPKSLGGGFIVSGKSQVEYLVVLAKEESQGPYQIYMINSNARNEEFRLFKAHQGYK